MQLAASARVQAQAQAQAQAQGRARGWNRVIEDFRAFGITRCRPADQASRLPNSDSEHGVQVDDKTVD